MSAAEYVPRDPILGTTVFDTADRVIADAMRIDTSEGWHDAAQQLWGVERLINTMRRGGSVWGVFYVLALGNDARRCERMARAIAAEHGIQP